MSMLSKIISVTVASPPKVSSPPPLLEDVNDQQMTQMSHSADEDWNFIHQLFEPQNVDPPGPIVAPESEVVTVPIVAEAGPSTVRQTSAAVASAPARQGFRAVRKVSYGQWA